MLLARKKYVTSLGLDRLAILVALLGLAGCQPVEEVPAGTPPPAPETAHEAYAFALTSAGLGTSELASQWQEAATASLEVPVTIDPPFREAVFYPADAPTATAYRVSVVRGQSISAALDIQPGDSAGVFLDIYEEQPGGRLERVASASEGATQIEYAPEDAGTYILRVQPELLRSVRVTIDVLRGATLAFPVLGRRLYDIGSGFGAPREGGRRSHHGVDIFAPRGTPVIAATDGRVSRVEETRLGGLVVWMRDDRRQSLYYAHLDRQLVEEGMRVTAGDTLGTVGNSGNARTTPPHLHFGIYVRRRGPVDPYPYIAQPSRSPPPIRADATDMGGWVRLEAETAVATESGSALRLETSELTRLPRHTVLRPIGAFGDRHRVLLPDGTSVVLRNASFEPLVAPIDEVALASGSALLDRPSPEALAKGQTTNAEPVPVLGLYGGYQLVRTPTVLQAWVQAGP